MCGCRRRLGTTAEGGIQRESRYTKSTGLHITVRCVPCRERREAADEGRWPRMTDSPLRDRGREARLPSAGDFEVPVPGRGLPRLPGRLPERLPARLPERLAARLEPGRSFRAATSLSSSSIAGCMESLTTKWATHGARVRDRQGWHPSRWRGGTYGCRPGWGGAASNRALALSDNGMPSPCRSETTRHGQLLLRQHAQRRCGSHRRRGQRRTAKRHVSSLQSLLARLVLRAELLS